MRQLLETHCPAILAIYPAGTIVAAQLFVTGGGNPQRIRDEAAFASLYGAAPIPASSGRTNRHRLNRGGDRRGSNALHRITLIRMHRDARTQTYVERRTDEGKAIMGSMRWLKRAVARENYTALSSDRSPAEHDDSKGVRTSKSIILTKAAEVLHTWPARISDIEERCRAQPGSPTDTKTGFTPLDTE